MKVHVSNLVGLAVILLTTSTAIAAKSGVQWTPDGDRILVNKDVGAERWAITLNLSDVSATGNVFFTDGRDPAFIWCEKTGQDFDAAVGELTVQYRCFGSDRAFGGFGSTDWTLISDEIFLPMSFYVPEAETCDLRDALNGANASNASSFWDCKGNGGDFQFQIFANGTGFSTEIGTFEFAAIDQACSFARLEDGSYLDVEYSPRRDLLTVYEIPGDVSSVILSECTRGDL